MPIDGRVLVGLSSLYGDVVSVDRFRRWKTEHEPIANALNNCVVGEIYWSKALGRPKTERLRDAFNVESWRTVRHIITKNGVQFEDDEGNTLPHRSSWWDGQEDGEFWRVAYLISDVPNGHRVDPIFGTFEEYTFVVPTLVRGVGWDMPGGILAEGAYGPRVLRPHRAVFVKSDGVKQISFRLIADTLLGFDASGVALIEP